jgi:SAM-dependent methyltransferase
MATDAVDRYAREQSFHDDRFTVETRLGTAKYYGVDAGRARYQAHLASVRPGQRVLEYGCGSGSAAFDLAAQGADVVGIDISPVGVRVATDTAAERGSTATFAVMNAEQLDVPDRSFDVICGSGILHHLDLDRALGEVARVLAPGGWAAFVEPLGTNPLINLYRRLTPSLRTVDEHPLVARDFEGIRSRFADVQVDHCNLLVLAATPFARLPGGSALVRALHRLDGWLFRALPATRRLAWVVVIRVAGPR